MSQLSFSVIFPHILFLYCSFNSGKVKELFSLCGSLGLNGFYTVKVKGFIPIEAVCADKIWTVHLAYQFQTMLDDVSVASFYFVSVVFRCGTWFHIMTETESVCLPCTMSM